MDLTCACRTTQQGCESDIRTGSGRWVEVDRDIVSNSPEAVLVEHEGFRVIHPCPHERDILFIFRHIVDRVLAVVLRQPGLSRSNGNGE